MALLLEPSMRCVVADMGRIDERDQNIDVELNVTAIHRSAR